MQVIIDAMPVHNRKLKAKMKRMRKRGDYRQDTIDGAVAEKQGSNRGAEVTFTNR